METFQFDGLQCRRLILGPFQVNTYLLFDPRSKHLLIVDPALAGRDLSQAIADMAPEKTTIFLTHGHADHILGVPAVHRDGMTTLLVSAEDAPMLTDPLMNLSQFMGAPITIPGEFETVRHGQTLTFGTTEATVVAVPGHTPGGVALVFPGFIFSGDTLFAGSIGRSDFPRGDGKLLVSMIRERLLSLSNRVVFPGHGPETEITIENESNPFLNGSGFFD